MKSRLVTASLIVVGIVTLGLVTTFSQQPSPRAVVNKDTVERWMKDLSNWGRWGADDQLGSLNLVTAQKRQQAMALAKTGTVVSLERKVVIQQKDDEIKADGQPSGLSYYEIRFRTFPKGDKRRNDEFNSDIQEFAVHGAGLTHLDALCHYSWNQKLYNGFPLEGVTADKGCAKDGLDNLKEGIVTRGVLVDMTRLKTATPRDPASTRVYPEDIEAWEKQTGLTVSAGDALFAYNPAPPAPAGAARGPAGGGRRVRPVGRAVDEDARRCGDERRVGDRGRHPRGPQVDACGARDVPDRRHGSDAARRDGSPAQPVGVSARGFARPGAGEHGLPGQPARDVLRRLSTFRGGSS